MCQVFLQRTRRCAPYDLTAAHDFGSKNAAAGSKHGATLDACFVADADLTSDYGVVFDDDAAGETGLGGDDDVVADRQL